MPTRRTRQKGNLYVKFTIEFPDNNWLEHNKLRLLEQLLPAKRPLSAPGSDKIVDEVELVETNLRDREARSRAAANEDDSDDHHGHPAGPGVQCAQQ